MHPPDSVMLTGTFIPLLAILLGGLLIPIPVAGLTLRFALKPALETFARVRELQGESEENRLIERRLALLEQHLQSLVLLRIIEEQRPQQLPEAGLELMKMRGSAVATDGHRS
jgi:hypothetical protein